MLTLKRFQQYVPPTSLMKLQLTFLKNIMLPISLILPHINTKPLFKLNNLLRVEDIYKFRLLIFYHILIYDKAPEHLKNSMPHNLREGRLLSLQKSKMAATNAFSHIYYRNMQISITNAT